METIPSVVILERNSQFKEEMTCVFGLMLSVLHGVLIRLTVKYDTRFKIKCVVYVFISKTGIPILYIFYGPRIQFAAIRRRSAYFRNRNLVLVSQTSQLEPRSAV